MLTKFELYQPAAIDNSLNSYQIIHKLIHQMNLIIDEINTIDSKANEYTDEQISLLNSQLRSYINELNEITIAHFEAVERDILTNSGDIADLQTGLRLLSDDFDLLSVSFDNLRIEVNQRITNANAAMKSYVDLQIQIIKELIEAQNPYVYGVYGRRLKLQSAFDELKNLTNFDTQKIPIKLLNRFLISSYTYSGAQYTYNALTFKELIDGLRAVGMSNTVYISLNVSNATKMSDTLQPNFKNVVHKPTLALIFALAAAMSQKHSSGYYNFLSIVTQTLYAQGWCFGTVGAMASYYQDYYN